MQRVRTFTQRTRALFHTFIVFLRNHQGLVLTIAALFFGAVASLGLLEHYSSTQGTVGPGKMTVSAQFDSRARTGVVLPPLGEISAETHEVPVALLGGVDEVDLDSITETLSRSDTEVALADLQEDVQADLEELARQAAAKVLVFSVIVGGLAGSLLPRRRFSHLIAGGFGGGIAVAVLLAGAWHDFDESAFNEPRYDGIVSRAPQILDNVQQHVDDISVVQERVDGLSRQITRLYATAAAGSPEEDATTAILHIGDIHSNPLGLEVALELADQLNVNAVLDTGDLTSFGQSVESQIASQIADSQVPYYFVGGNHDSNEVKQSIVDRASNVTLLDGDVVDVQGVRILGVSDPTFTADNGMSTAQANIHKELLAPLVTKLTHVHQPDLLAVHDPNQASGVWGKVPVVVAGHRHKRDMREKDGTRLYSVGSTGATGLEEFLVETGRPYEAEVLRFNGLGELVAVDYLIVNGIGGDFVLERDLIEPPSMEVESGEVMSEPLLAEELEN